jgi:hypothetical protein
MHGLTEWGEPEARAGEGSAVNNRRVCDATGAGDAGIAP